jgi:uncharacterized protein (DUF952 family)
MATIFHLAPAADIDRAARTGQYAPTTLASEGFIHCSYAHQVQGVADALFRNSGNVVLLEIDPDRLNERIVDEGDGERFPHVYGPLPMSAVLSVRELKRGSDGALQMPCTVTGNCSCKG